MSIFLNQTSSDVIWMSDRKWAYYNCSSTTNADTEADVGSNRIYLSRLLEPIVAATALILNGDWNQNISFV